MGGQIARIGEDGIPRYRQCSCQKTAYNLYKVRKSGLGKLVDDCTFDSFLTNAHWQEEAKHLAEEYLTVWKDNSFFISGQSGAGKTHLCTAIVSTICKQGKSMEYFRWVHDGTRLKVLLANDPAQYEEKLGQLLRCELLYIDDLYKIKPTDADYRLFFDIIDGRYTQKNSTIISTERSLSFFDEATAGRIREMTGNGQFCLALSGADKNQRIKRPEDTRRQ